MVGLLLVSWNFLFESITLIDIYPMVNIILRIDHLWLKDIPEIS